MKTRVATAIAAAVPILVAFACSNRWPLLLIAAAATLVATYELSALARLEGRRVSLSALVVGAILAATVGYPGTRLELGASLALAVTLIGVFAAGRLRAQGGSVLFFEIGTLWIVGPLLSLISLHQAQPLETLWNPANLALMALVPIWVGDSAAMLVGKAWGKRLLAPKLSPKKTVEGAAANLLGCILSAAALAPWLQIQWGYAIGCGVACGVLGQAGDLFQSSLKRAADLKDSGSILPGHGGLLDRIDSLLFAAPAVALILAAPGARAG